MPYRIKRYYKGMETPREFDYLDDNDRWTRSKKLAKEVVMITSARKLASAQLDENVVIERFEEEINTGVYAQLEVRNGCSATHSIGERRYESV